MSEVAAGDGSHPRAAGYTLLASLVLAWPAWRAWFA
jgi:acyl-CoA thioesterase I